MELREIRRNIEQLKERLKLVPGTDESRNAVETEIEELKLLEVMGEAELSRGKARPGEISSVDPLTLKPHPISVALYVDLDSSQEMPGWRADSLLSPELARLAVLDRTNIMDLLESIKRNDIRVPLVINEDGFIISGCRRWKVAVELRMKSVPVEVRSFKSEAEEKQAILDYNRYREKTLSQKMRESDLLKEIVAARAKQRMLAGRQDPTPTFGEGYSPKRHERETAAIVGARVGMGKDSYRRGQQIWDEAKAGNRKAAQLILAVDRHVASVNGAYNALKKNMNGVDEPTQSRWQRLKSVDSGEVCTCPYCHNRVQVVHAIDGNNKHKLVESRGIPITVEIVNASE